MKRVPIWIDQFMRVVFVQKFVPHYRLPFFLKIREILADAGIEFVLIYGTPDPVENSKVKMEYPEWGIHAKTRHVGLAGRYLYWENAFKHIKRGDFVVVEHAAKLLDNYLLFLLRQIGYLKMGYFGHGHNFQATTEYKVAAILKTFTLRRVDRWFVYTDLSKQSLIDQSVDTKIITVVNNTLKESENRHLADAEPKPMSCVFIGGMYNLKLIPLLLEAGEKIAAKIPEFELHMVGQGPDKPIVDKAAEQHQWLNVHGALYGIDRDKVLASCNAILMPGLVGLIAIDSFQFVRPIISSDAGEHSPEIAYLQHGENCLIAQKPVDAESYANAVLSYLSDENLQTSLKEGCTKSAQKYSIDNMAQNFCDAVFRDAQIEPKSSG